MVVKCREKGQGVFKLVNRTVENDLNQGQPAKSNLPSQEEVLDYVRFTHTLPTSQPNNLTQVPKELNTLCLSANILQNDKLLFELAEKIVGEDFLQKNIEFKFNSDHELESCTLPGWMSSNEFYTPAKWFLALIEISIQYHYTSFIAGLNINSTKSEQINATTQLISHENQLIDSQNKIYEILSNLKEKYSGDQQVLFDLIQRCEDAEVKELSMIIALFMNQEPAQLATDLCLTSIYKLQTSDFDGERDFINLLLAMTQSKVSEQQKKALKNQKKKNKRKQKKAQQQQQNQQQVSPQDPNEEEKMPQTSNMDQPESALELTIEKKHTKDDLHKDIEHHKSHSKRKESHKEHREHLDFQDIFSDSNIFQLLELEGEFKENDRSQSNERLDKLSSFSDSTVDILGNFSSDNFKNILKSPQHSTNTEIELDIRKNLYSSDAGDSSIQLQKQFSDYYFIKDSSNINIDLQNQTKTKESIDNLQIDVSISNDNTVRNDDSARQTSGKKVMLQLSANKQATLPGIEEPSSNFQIIRSSQTYLQEQQAMKQNQRKKKNKNGKKGKGNATTTGGQSSHLAAQQRQMNNFIRNMLQHNEQEEEYDEYEQDEQYVQNKEEPITQKNVPLTESKRPVYVKKTSTNNSQGNKTVSQDQPKITDSPGNLIKSSVQTPSTSNKKSVESSGFTNDQFQSQQGIDLSRKKKNTKGKKSNNNWEKGGKKKGGKSKGSQPSQSQLAKQNSYEGHYNQSFGSLALPRQSSMFDNQYLQNDIINPLLNGGQLDIEGIKNIIQQNLIQETIQAQIIAQQQQQQYLQQTQQLQESYEPAEDYDQEENLDDEEARDIKLTETFFENLENQMINYQKQIEKKLESVRKERETAIQIIRNIVANLYKDERNSVAVKLYGSMASNLSIDTSDVDLAVVGLDFQGCKDRQINEMRKLIEQINLIMKKSTSLKFIETATVPVIKLEIDLVQIAKSHERNEKNEYGPQSARKIIIDDSMRYLGIDITYEDTIKQHYYGVHVENLSRINLGIKCINYIKELCKDQPGLQTIVLVLKKLLQVNDLNQTFTGGLNSYSIVLMTTAYLRQFPNVQSMSKNLVEFFHFYGEFFDPKSTVICSHQLPYFIKHQFRINEAMIINDPLDVNNNPARGAYQIGRIQQLFKDSYQVLMECLNQFKQDQQVVDVVQVLMNHSQKMIQMQHSSTSSFGFNTSMNTQQNNYQL